MRLTLIKTLHTVVWAVLAGGILAIAPLAIAGHFRVVLGITLAVLLETVVLAVNGWRCPLTPWAARYTEDREPCVARLVLKKVSPSPRGGEGWGEGKPTHINATPPPA